MHISVSALRCVFSIDFELADVRKEVVRLNEMSDDPSNVIRISRAPKNSAYTVSERQRIRLALIQYVRRNGLSYQRTLDELNNVVEARHQGVIKDKVQIGEFLRGAEQRDDKINAYLEYLSIVAPHLVKHYGDCEFVEGVAATLRTLSCPQEGANGYDLALQRTERHRSEGLYLGVLTGGVGRTSAVCFLHMRSSKNAPFYRCDFFVIDPIWGEPSSLSVRHKNTDTLKFGVADFHDDYVSLIKKLNNGNVSESECQKSISELVLLMESYMQRTRQDGVIELQFLKLIQSGIVYEGAMHPQMLVRDILRRNLMLKDFKILNENNITTWLLRDEELVSKVKRKFQFRAGTEYDRSGGASVHGKSYASDGKFDIKFYRIFSDPIEELAGLVSWSLPG